MIEKSIDESDGLESLKPYSGLKHSDYTITKTELPIEPLLTRKQVARILQVDVHTLSVKRKEWADILPVIQFKGSNLVRYRYGDVMRLMKKNAASVSDHQE